MKSIFEWSRIHLIHLFGLRSNKWNYGLCMNWNKIIEVREGVKTHTDGGCILAQQFKLHELTLTHFSLNGKLPLFAPSFYVFLAPSLSEHNENK